MLYQLISECTDYDFKVALEIKKPKSWLKTVSAFANTIGGTLFFGIDNNKQIVGVDNSQKISDKISEGINSRIKPTPMYALTPFLEDEKVIIALKVYRGTATPYYYDADGVKEAFIRSGNESIIAPNHILNELILKGSNRTYDAVVTNFKKTDYSFTLLEATFLERTSTHFSDTDCRSFNLVDENGFLTNAGVLLADQNIYLHSRVFCTRWNGITKTSIHGEALDDKEISGGLLQQLFSAVDFVRSNTKKKWRKEGLIRVESPEYDEEAVREAVVNAIVHREYTRLGAEVCVDIYDDRLEITSPGSMFSGKPIEREITSVVASERRNPHIADLFARMNFMERRGSGLKKISDKTNMLFADGENHVQFYSDNSYFRVIIQNANYSAKVQNEPLNESLDEPLALTDIENNILGLIKGNPHITKNDIAEGIGCSRATVQRALSRLQELNVITRANGKRFGYWEIK